MINFEYLILFFLFLLTLVLISGIAKYIRYKHLLKLLKIHILRRQQKTAVSFYADTVLKKCVRKLFFSRSLEAKKSLAKLIFGRTKAAELFLAQKDEILALFLRAHTEAKSAYSALKRKKLSQNKDIYQLLFADLALKFFDYDKARSVINGLKNKKFFGIKKALYNRICAELYINDADMLSASMIASMALKYFQKHDMPIEEAETYLLLGEIYRVSYVNDVAQTMLESALKIYQKSNLKLFEAKILAVLGMLMVGENRFAEAEDKFNRALELTDLSQTKAEILNQFALLEIARKNHKKSFEYANQALVLHEGQKNARGIAFSLQILAHLNSDKRHFTQSLECSQKASEIYEKQKNFSAVCECLYLKSTVLYKQKKYKKAEELLRKILNISEKYGVNFHHANAYSLLGLIYLQKKDLQRSKVLFQQSLHLEQRNNRSPGMAADYVNLSLLESMDGDKDTAKENLKIALEHALKTEDEELIKLIKERI